MKKLIGKVLWLAAVASGAVLGAAPMTARAESPTGLDAPAATCGKSGLPDCPMQAWMKDNVVKPKAAGDYDTVAAAMGKVPGLSPDKSWVDDWKKISDEAAKWAKAKNKEEMNKACNACHDKYKKEYREKYRDKPLPK
jgi:hypothetical protein